jgi:signal transduction histidine kinase
MSELRGWLESRQAHLVASLETALAGAERAWPLSHRQVAAFVLAVAAATERGIRDIELLLRRWHEENAAEELPGRWVTAILVVREAIWAHVVSEFSPAKALNHLRALDRVFMEIIGVAGELDVQNRVHDQERLLEKTRDQLRQMEQSKSNFIKIAAHELKTPLTLIDGYANMLMTEIPEQARPRTDILLGGIANGTRRLGEIIEGMIDVSMIDTQVLDVTFQPLYVRQLVKTVVEDLETVLRIRQIELTVDPFPQDGTPTYGDSERLYQAIYNVLGNAIKFTPDHGRIHIRNSVIKAGENSPREVSRSIEIQVSDTGIGIAPENLDHVFDKLVGLGSVALHSTGKYTFKGGGPGLGLAISRGILEAHGGAIWASSPGHDEIRCPGSTFHLLVPLYDQPPTRRTAPSWRQGLTDTRARQSHELCPSHDSEGEGEQ